MGGDQTQDDLLTERTLYHWATAAVGGWWYRPNHRHTADYI